MSNVPHPSDDADLNDALQHLAGKAGEKIERDPTGPRHLTKSQVTALQMLSSLYQLQGQPERGGIVPRNKPLLVGPSGVGKTAVVRRLCDLEEADLLVVNAGSWIPFGAATHPHTLTTIRQFIARQGNTCLLIDEIDKACPGQHTFGHSWSLGVFTELISLLDADLKLTTAGWSREQIEQFRRSVFIVGAGTWQRVTAKVGSDAATPESYEIPEEILFRFNPTLVRLRPPERIDYAQAIRRVHGSLGLMAPDSDEGKRLVDSAVESRIGMRWVEHYLTQLLIQHPSRRALVEVPKAAKSDHLQCSARDLEQKMTRLNADLEAAQGPVAELAAVLRSYREESRLRPGTPKPLSIDAMKAMVSELDILREGLQLNACISLSEMRGLERVLLASSSKVIEGLRHWIRGQPRVLKKWGILSLVVEVEVRMHRIRSMVTSIPHLRPYDAP